MGGRGLSRRRGPRRSPWAPFRFKPHSLVSGKRPMENVRPTGPELLRNPHLNRGSAFSLEERRALGIEGFLPPAVDTIETQAARVHAQLDALDSDLQKYLF